MKIGYTGKMKNGRAHGYGVYTYASGDVYEGNWANDNKSGYGRLTHLDGSFYEGEYFLDRRHGRGTYHYCNGDEYVGNWKNGRAHGHGIFRNKSHGVVYKDTWSNGRSIKTGSPMTSMLQSSWRTLATNESEHRAAGGTEKAAEPGSPVWRNPSKQPQLLKAPRPKTAPALRNPSSITATGLARTRLMETIIMQSLGANDKNWV